MWLLAICEGRVSKLELISWAECDDMLVSCPRERFFIRLFDFIIAFDLMNEHRVNLILLHYPIFLNMYFSLVRMGRRKNNVLGKKNMEFRRKKNSRKNGILCEKLFSIMKMIYCWSRSLEHLIWNSRKWQFSWKGSSVEDGMSRVLL